MAVTPFNYSNIAPIGAPGVRNLADSLRQGMEAGAMPRRTALQNQNMELQNALSQMKIQQAKQEMERMQEFQNLFSGFMPGSEGAQMQGVEGAPAQMGMAQPRMEEQVKMNLSEAIQARNGTPARYIDEQGTETIIENPGNPMMQYIDKIWDERPDMRDALQKIPGIQAPKRSTEHSAQTGQIFSTTVFPSGRVERKAFKIGRSPEERERARQVAIAEGDQYKQALSAVQHADDMGDKFDYLFDEVNTPEFYNITGPLASTKIGQFFQSPEQRDKFGKLASATGEITLTAAKSIHGAFTGRDQNLIESLKPTMKDFPEVFLGKLVAMSTLNEQVNKRNELIAKYMKDGKSFLEARNLARMATPLDEYRNKYEGLVSSKKDVQRRAANDARLSRITKPKDAQVFLATLSPDERAHYKAIMEID